LPTVLLGINDGGKTAVLHAIGLLLDPTKTFAAERDATAKRDLSNAVLDKPDFDKVFEANSLPVVPYSGQDACVIGKLILERADFEQNLTDEYSNHLLWVVENSADLSLWLLRVFNNSGSQETLLLTRDAGSTDVNLQELWSKKPAELKSLRSSIGVVDTEIKNVNEAGRFTKLEQVRAIYAKTTLQYQWRRYDFKKDSEFFPQYRYLDWNFNLEDLKKIASDVMKGIIDEHTNKLRKNALSEANDAQKEINDALTSYVSLLQQDVPTLSGLKTHVVFDVKPSVSDILLNKINTDRDIHLDSQGEGVKRQIWFGLIRIAAGQATKTKGLQRKKFVWCFDEPETHLYPAAQRKFFDALKNLAASEFHIVVSTHSTIFVDRTNLSSIRNTGLEDRYTTIGVCADVDDIFETLQVRNSDFFFHDKFLIVEGDTELELIPYFYQLIKKRTLAQDGIRLISLGGKEKRAENIKTLKNILGGFRKPEKCSHVLLDADARHVALPTDGLAVTYVGKQDIEDSVDANVWLKTLASCELVGLITAERIKEIQAAIPDGAAPKNEKFLERLRSELLQTQAEHQRQRVIANFPRKGRNLGKLLRDVIKVPEEIPTQIMTLLETL
jgi:predicted ATP-dependent endonuclease of OLD family